MTDSDKHLEKYGLLSLREMVQKNMANIEKLQDELEIRTTERDNLLCRIHRDGGHYISEHGIEKALMDADIKVAEMFNEVEELQAQYKEEIRLLGESEVEKQQLQADLNHKTLQWEGVKDMLAEANNTIGRLWREIKGFAGGNVYRHSHEDVSKELGALRRYATELITGELTDSKDVTKLSPLEDHLTDQLSEMSGYCDTYLEDSKQLKARVTSLELLFQRINRMKPSVALDAIDLVVIRIEKGEDLPE